MLQIPTRDGQPTACWYAAASGNLVLGSGTFSYRLTFENTCTGGVLWKGSVEGSYQQNGTALTFLVPSADGDLRLSGTASADSLSIDEPAHSLTFERQREE